MPKKKVPNLVTLVSQKLKDSPVFFIRRLEKCLMAEKSKAIKHHPDNESLIEKAYDICVKTLITLNQCPPDQSLIISMLASPQEPKRTTLNDKLRISKDIDLITILLFKISVLESISNEKAYRQFWTPAYKALSEKLSLPIETDYVDSHSTYLNRLSPRPVEKSRFWTVMKKVTTIKNCQTTSCQSYISSIVDKWDDEATPNASLKTVKIRILPTPQQIKEFKYLFDEVRFVYNRCVADTKVNNNFKWEDLRNKYVTEKTRLLYTFEYDDKIKCLNKFLKKNTDDALLEELNYLKSQKDAYKKSLPPQRNPNVYDFELRVQKDIRTGACRRLWAAYDSRQSALKNGTIKYFNIGYCRKANKLKRDCIDIPNNCISLCKNGFKMCPIKFKSNNINSFIKIHNCSIKTLKRNNIERITHDCKLVKDNENYYIYLCVDTPVADKTFDPLKDFVCGIDPGCRTFMTVYSKRENGVEISEYIHNEKAINKLENEIDILKGVKNKRQFDNQRRSYKRIRRRAIAKRERKLKSYIDAIHYDTINDIVKNNKIIFMGDIKSHGITKGNKNHTLNRTINGLKFFQFKQRLMDVGLRKGCKVVLTNESYTTKTCSKCGSLNHEVKNNEVYYCVNDKCNKVYPRDINASKNILMRGVLG